jgi:hypothetical protein
MTVGVYPPRVEDLLPQARVLAAELDAIPSRNRLMAELKIGAPKATALRDQLAAEARQETAEPDPEPTEPGESEPRTQAPGPNPIIAQATRVGHPGSDTRPPAAAEPRVTRPAVRTWPLLVLAAPAFVSIWSGWVGLGGLTGFGQVRLLPGIADNFTINSAITLPIGVEAYAAYALRAWLTGAAVPTRARRFAKWSAIGSLVLGAAGQIAYHLMAAWGWTHAPWPVTAAVACLPVVVLGMGVALAHLLNHTTEGASN